MVNFLEQLVAEWYEFNGYFVRRNVKVGPRTRGGYECELDVVAFHPEKKHLVHVEPSTAADSWAEREAKFAKKFKADADAYRDCSVGSIFPPRSSRSRFWDWVQTVKEQLLAEAAW